MWRITLAVVLLCTLHVSSGEICRDDVCEYNFDVRHARTMTYSHLGTTYVVVMNGSQVISKPGQYKKNPPSNVVVEDVITADGFPRTVLVVNSQMPGPTIEVMEGAQVVVHVTNHLLTQSISIHWHGMHQRDTVWMDGVSYITQCPIIPSLSFTYRFYANPVGTHWWHGHDSNQRIDGFYGALIVHPKNPILPVYPEFIMQVTDWYHHEAQTLEITNTGMYNGAGEFRIPRFEREYGPDNVFIAHYEFKSGLINGRGRYQNEAPLTEYVVKQGDKYRFRMICASSKYSFEVSIDDHMLEVVALDGQDIQPIQVDSVMIHPGERVDFLVTADQAPRNYWIRSLTTRACTGINCTPDGVEQGMYGIFRYEIAPPATPTTQKKICTSSNECVTFNCPWARYADGIYKRCIPLDDARSAYQQSALAKEFGLDGPADETYYINIGYHVESSINGLKFIHPALPWSEPDYEDKLISCDRPDCNRPDGGCGCTHVIHLPFNKTVDMVLTNYRPQKYVSHHPMHIHGHNFAILKIGQAGYNTTSGWANSYNPDIACTTPFCKNTKAANDNIQVNTNRPPIKDTVNVPGFGYTIIRFRTDNPGPWIFHCHVSNHFAEGMALVFEEAEEYTPYPPPNFPRCGDFEMSEGQFARYLESQKGIKREGSHEDSHEDNDFMMRTTPKPNRPNRPGKHDDDDDDKDGDKFMVDKAYLAGRVTLKNGEFIGVVIGSVAAGAVLVMLGFCVFAGRRGKTNSV